MKHSNQESLREAGSLMLSMDDLLPLEQPRLFTRISSLQRLKVQYVHNGLVQIREHLKYYFLKVFYHHVPLIQLPTYLK